MLTLYGVAISPYVRKVKIALWEKGIPFESRVADPFLGILPDTFVAASPRLEVPVLVDDDLSIFDSTIILEYLEDAYPNPPLRPAAPADRARARMLEEIADTQLEAAIWALGEIRFFKRAVGAQAEHLTAAAQSAIGRHFDRLERELASRPYLSGLAFGTGDLALVPPVTAAAFFGMGPGSGHPRLSDWLRRMQERDSVQKDATDVLAAATSFGTQAGVRQCRDHRLEWLFRHGGQDIVCQGLERGTLRLSADA
jgi:glutathione S-transferase/RNA polymerase-associated protein